MTFENIVSAQPAIPTITELQERITSLTNAIEQKNDLQRITNDSLIVARQAQSDFKNRVKNVLTEALEDYDEDTVKHIAEQLDIPLTVTKQVEVNVTFTIDLEYEIGDEPDLDWDLDFTVSHNSIQDYQVDTIWTKDA